MNAQPLRGGELPITGGKQTTVWPLAEDEKIACDPGKARLNVDDTEQAPMLASWFNSFLAGTKNDPRWGLEHPTAPILTAWPVTTLQGAAVLPHLTGVGRSSVQGCPCP